MADTEEGVLEECYKRAVTDKNWGGSTKWKSHRKGAIVYNDHNSVNPDYYNWNKMMVPYCDGTLHMGLIEKPIPYKDIELYFWGYTNTVEAFKYILENYNFYNAESAILTGLSAGVLFLNI
jgi:hypothetical protein